MRLSYLLLLLWNTYDVVMDDQSQYDINKTVFVIVCENPEHQAIMIVMCCHHKDAKQACPRFYYCKMELFQRESKIGEIRQANQDWRKWEVMMSWWEDQGNSLAQRMLSLNVFFCSCLNLGFLVPESLWNSDQKLQLNTSDWIYSVHLYWKILEQQQLLKQKCIAKENLFGLFLVCLHFFSWI